MIHLGDITKIDWSAVPPVDCVTGGSPCQDLSVAGKRAGLAGERSGLYMEQIRCVKELRNADKERGRTGQFIRPRYMVWENVPGAFSSNKGKDFAAVLEEAVKVAEPETPPIPVPEGGWPYAGCLTDGVAGRWSIAWRVHDAQFWGVPQRRRRISLVCDFGGQSAPEILFERKGLSGDSEPGGAQREEVAADAESGAGGTGFGETGVGYWQPGIQTLRAEGENRPSRPSNVVVQEDCDKAYCLQGNGIDRSDTAGCNGKGWREDVCYTLNTIDRPAVYDARENGDGKTVCTLTGDHQNRVTDYTALCIGNGQANQSVSDKAGALNTMHDQQAVMVLNDQGGSVMDVSNESTATLRAQSHGHEPAVMVAAVDCRNLNEHQEVSGTLQCKQNGGYSLNYQNPIRVQGEVAHKLKAKANCDFRADSETYPVQNSVVRRLTPLECERLQGYPDGWTDIGEWVDSKGKKHKPADSPRYKALGNSIALPFWFWLLRRISAQYYRPATLGSLFDGIGGFPLCWERCNGKGTALWASEIEEFPMAVTKIRFADSTK